MLSPYSIRSWVCVLVFGLHAGLMLPAQAQDDTANAAVDVRHALVDSLVQPLTVDVPWGAVVGIVDAEGRRYFTYGGSASDSSAAVDSTTIFEIGSVTKTYTALLLADLVTREIVTLDTPVQALLPDSVDVPAFEGQPITLRHLATHHSGLPRVPDNLLSSATNPFDPYAAYSTDDLYAFLNSYTLPRAPGTEYAYSNLGMGLLGHALAVRADSAYAGLVQARIAQPLGLPDTAIRLSDGQKRRLIQGYNMFQAPTPPWTFDVMAPAGAVRSTARDQLRYLAAHIGLSPTPLDSTLRATRTPLAQASAQDSVAYGWHIRTVDGARMVWHNGGTAGFSSFVAYAPARNVGVVLLVNGPLHQRVTEVGFRLLASLAASAHPPAD